MTDDEHELLLMMATGPVQRERSAAMGQLTEMARTGELSPRATRLKGLLQGARFVEVCAQVGSEGAFARLPAETAT